MPKSYINRDYHTQLSAFVAKVSRDRNTVMAPNNAEFFIGTGRKYDKVIQKEVTTHGEQILYMVVKTSGNIYGAKTATRPNFLRFFGTLSTAPLWDWSNTFGIPVTDTTVELINQYGDVPHYVPALDSVARRSYLHETRHMTRPLRRRLLTR